MIPNPNSDRKVDGRIGRNWLLFFFHLLLLLSSTFFFLLKLRMWVGRIISSPPHIYPLFSHFCIILWQFNHFSHNTFNKYYIYNSCHNGYLDPYPCIPRAKNTYPSFKQSSIHPSTLVIYSICQFLPSFRDNFGRNFKYLFLIHFKSNFHQNLGTCI